MVGIFAGKIICAVSWCDLDLTFDLALVTLILSGLHLINHKMKNFVTWQVSWFEIVGEECHCMTYNLGQNVSTVTAIYKTYFSYH